MKTSANTTSSILPSAPGLTRRRSFKSLAAAAPLLAVMAFAAPAFASPNGTRPTILTNVSVTSVSASQMRARGTLTTLSGAPIAGMRVDIYSVGVASFTRTGTVYTANNGTFTATMPKPPAGMKVQVEVEGNGAYSRPLLTFNRP